MPKKDDTSHEAVYSYTMFKASFFGRLTRVTFNSYAKKNGSSPEAVKSYTMLRASFLGHIDYTVNILTMQKKGFLFNVVFI